MHLAVCSARQETYCLFFVCKSAIHLFLLLTALTVGPWIIVAAALALTVSWPRALFLILLLFGRGEGKLWKYGTQKTEIISADVEYNISTLFISFFPFLLFFFFSLFLSFAFTCNNHPLVLGLQEIEFKEFCFNMNCELNYFGSIHDIKQQPVIDCCCLLILLLCERFNSCMQSK